MRMGFFGIEQRTGESKKGDVLISGLALRLHGGDIATPFLIPTQRTPMIFIHPQRLQPDRHFQPISTAHRLMSR